MDENTQHQAPPDLELEHDPTEGLPLFVNAGLPLRDSDVERMFAQEQGG